MMNKALKFSMFSLLIALVSCGPGEKKEKEEAPVKEEVSEAAVCTYMYDQETTEVMWVAYKYSEKTGVKGVFDQVIVEGVQSSDEPQKVFENVTFSIPTSSVNSGDAIRDPKIQESFFGMLTNGAELNGSIQNIEGNGEQGKMKFMLDMNGVEHEIDGAYTVVDNKLEVKAEINVSEWNAMPAIESLNKVCEDLHKGADGESILWPDVTLFISSTLQADCK